MRETKEPPTVIHLFACTLNKCSINSLRNIRIMNFLWFSKAWFNAWQIIIHHCALLLNKWKNCELFTSSHGTPNLQAFCFPLNMSHLQTLEVSFMLLQGSKPFTFGKSDNVACVFWNDWLHSCLYFWLSHWDHFYSHNQWLMGMWISLGSGETYYFLTHVFSFLTRMRMLS